MKYLKVAVICFFIAFVLFACSNNNGKREFVIANSKSYEASLFRQNCAICHGQEAEGKEMADGTIVPTLRAANAAKKTEDEIYDQIANGKNPMPSFKNQLTKEELQKMTRFVTEDLQGRKENSENNVRK